MKRLTISVPDGLAEYAQSQVAAGSAPSMSAWVADAMRRKA
jgi:Arc/MetJ-type ribon-helix-helix transcriptional regulator